MKEMIFFFICGKSMGIDWDFFRGTWWIWKLFLVVLNDSLKNTYNFFFVVPNNMLKNKYPKTALAPLIQSIVLPNFHSKLNLHANAIFLLANQKKLIENK